MRLTPDLTGVSGLVNDFRDDLQSIKAELAAVREVLEEMLELEKAKR